MERLNSFNTMQGPTIIAQDNTGSIAWATGSSASQFAKRKHVDIRYHFVVAKIREGCIAVRKVKTEDMESDFLTKVLQPHHFIHAINKFNIMDMDPNHRHEEECWNIPWNVSDGIVSLDIIDDAGFALEGHEPSRIAIVAY